MLADAGVLDYERSLAAFRRIARRCALGDAAADDTELSEEHSRLRADADWLGLKVWARRRDARLRASMDARIQRYVSRRRARHARQSLSVRAQGGGDRSERPGAVLADGARRGSHRGLQRAGAADDSIPPRTSARSPRSARRTAAHGPGTVAGLAELAFVRACLLDSVRLWPAAAMLVRVTAAETEWYGETLPIGARVLIPVVAHHRARRLPQANRFAPDLWLDGSADADWQMNVFSRGGAQCAGRNLALLLGTASLAELLRQREFELLRPKLAPDRPLPVRNEPVERPICRSLIRGIGGPAGRCHGAERIGRHPSGMTSHRRLPAERDRAVARLRSLTRGAAVGGVLGTLLFGAVAAASYDGTATTTTTTAAASSDDSAAQVAADDSTAQRDDRPRRRRRVRPTTASSRPPRHRQPRRRRAPRTPRPAAHDRDRVGRLAGHRHRRPRRRPRRQPRRRPGGRGGRPRRGRPGAEPVPR